MTNLANQTLIGEAIKARDVFVLFFAHRASQELRILEVVGSKVLCHSL